MSKENPKNDAMIFAIETEAKEKFKKGCAKEYTTMSAKLYAFVHSTNERFDRNVTLSEMTERK